MIADDFMLTRNTAGRLVLSDAAGLSHVGVVPVRAFPLSAPGESLSLVSAEGHELAWIEQPQQLPEATRQLLEEELALREFLPEIRQIKQVSTFSTPSTWHVETDRGPTHFVLRGEEDIRRLGDSGLLITAEHGVHLVVSNMRMLDRPSRKLLERFL
ncbi:MAG TPA: DUF1854 domain-containing protein [Burkholderiaceae bacterium]